MRWFWEAETRAARLASSAPAVAVPDSRFTYATGRLALFSKDPGLVTGEATLKDAAFTRIAIANPTTAPYGAAAVEVMRALGVYDAVSGRIVQGNNIAQTYQFVETGNAELGFIALSQIAGGDAGSRWLVPEARRAARGARPPAAPRSSAEAAAGPRARPRAAGERSSGKANAKPGVRVRCRGCAPKQTTDGYATTARPHAPSTRCRECRSPAPRPAGGRAARPAR